MAISKKQFQILSFPYTKYDCLICDGAIRAGKTSFMTIAFIDDAMRRFDRQRFGICGKTVDSTVKNIIAPYLSMTRPHEEYSIQWRRADKLLVVSDGEKENYFEVFGGKDESSYTLIQGRTFAGVLIDEVALQPRSFVEQALARCSVHGSKLWFNCNPEGPNHWFYKEWIQQPKKHNALHLHFQLEDNPALDESIITRYKSMYSGVFYDRYIRGLWVRAEGTIYHLFASDPDRYSIKKSERPRLSSVSVGVDFGGNKSAFAFVASGLTEDYDIIALRSQRVPAKGVSVEQMMSKFIKFCDGVEDDFNCVIDYVYADSAEQAIINSMYQQTRFNIRNSVKGQIIDRIRTMDICLSSNRFKYIEGECDSLVSALCDAVWDPDQLEDVRLDDGTSDIDSLDAFEYSWNWAAKQILRAN